MSFFTGNLAFDILGVITALLAISVAYIKRKYTYWSRVGLTTLNPTIPFGDAKKLLLLQCSFGTQFKFFYQQLKTKGLRHGGVYLGIRPFYIPVDPKIIKQILQVDFQHFVNHGNYTDVEIDPLSGHLFNLEDEKWKNMRAKLTPTFTSGKMKMMFKNVVDCLIGLEARVEEAANNGKPVDIKEIFGRFATDVIGSTALGLDTNTLQDPNSSFRRFGKKVFENNTLQRIKALSQFALPHSVLRILRIKMTESDVERFFMKTVQDIVAYREKHNVYRKDFMHLLLQLKNRGTVANDDKILNEDGKIQEKTLTVNELAAQVFVFFIAGFETSSATQAFALYELAVNPDIQDKLRDEIRTVLAKYNGQVTYDGIMEMKYLEKTICETLRKYPPSATLRRKCTQDYTVPGTSIHLRKGVIVAISALGLHTDPDYYPNPEVFDPERFSEENKKTRPTCTWLPFGEGPRQCIGLRFGMLQTKVGLVGLLRNYRVRLNKKTKTPIKFAVKNATTAAEGGIWLNVEKLN